MSLHIFMCVYVQNALRSDTRFGHNYDFSRTMEKEHLQAIPCCTFYPPDLSISPCSSTLWVQHLTLHCTYWLTVPGFSNTVLLAHFYNQLISYNMATNTSRLFVLKIARLIFMTAEYVICSKCIFNISSKILFKIAKYNLVLVGRYRVLWHVM